MKKKLLALALLVLCLPAFLLAQVRVVDNAGLLSESEKANLERQSAEIASKYRFDLVIVSETDIGNAQLKNYAADFFDNGGYSEDGCLFLHVTGSRDYRFYSGGKGKRILNDIAFGKLDSDVLRFLSNNDHAGAYQTFINAWDEFLALDAKGRGYNVFHRWNAALVVIAWLLSLAIGVIIVEVWKAQMNTAIPKKEADPYIVAGSLVFTAQKERFLYSNVTKTRRQTQSVSSAKIRGGKY